MSDPHSDSPILSSGLDGYTGRWVAMLQGRVIAQGGTPEQALNAAKKSRFKETPQVIYIPMKEPLHFPPILDQIVQYLPDEVEVYLVGGAVRDTLLNRKIRDLDFIVAGNSLEIARKLADRIGASYFTMDEERGTARLVLDDPQSGRMFLDFSTMRGTTLEKDLRERDFTINAMAVSVRNYQKILDPLSGAVDLVNHKLRACSSSSIQNDPVRILRAVRFAGEYDLEITPDTRLIMRSSIEGLSGVSAERIRDELFRILSGIQPARAIRVLDILGALPLILPELPALKGVEQSSPHISDVWEHTLNLLNRLEVILDVLTGDYNPDDAANLLIGMAVARLGRYRNQLTDHLAISINVDRSLRGLLFFAALYHDTGKPRAKHMGDGGRIHFYDHERIGSELASRQAKKLHLSNLEIKRINNIIRNHMRPILLAQSDDPPTRRAVYRFFRDTGIAGVDICLLTLADTLATYGTGISTDKWQKQIDVIRALYQAWWEYPEEYIRVSALLSGGDLINELNLKPGPLIGELLDLLREAQVVGLVHTREQAITYLINILNENYMDYPTGQSG